MTVPAEGTAPDHRRGSQSARVRTASALLAAGRNGGPAVRGRVTVRARGIRALRAHVDEQGLTTVNTGDAAGSPAQESGKDRSLPPGLPSGRVDRWLWAVRLAKTRQIAAQGCRGGHVRVNDRPAKPATPVRPGDVVKVKLAGTPRIVEVSHVIDKRVGAPVAVRCYVDHTPAPSPESKIPVAKRERGAGRPTKRERRQIDRLRGMR